MPLIKQLAAMFIEYKVPFFCMIEKKVMHFYYDAKTKYAVLK